MKWVFFLVIKEHSHDSKSVVLLQDCVGLIKDEPDYVSEVCETILDDGNEEFSVEVEEADINFESVDIKEEHPEVKILPQIKTELEVSVCGGLCVRYQQFMLPRPFTTQKENFCNYILPILMYVPCSLYNGQRSFSGKP